MSIIDNPRRTNTLKIHVNSIKFWFQTISKRLNCNVFVNIFVFAFLSYWLKKKKINK